MAHEPLLLIWGHRGRRAQQFSSQAFTRAALLWSVMIVGGAVAFALGTTAVRFALVACLAVAVATFAVAVRGQHRTLAAELWATASGTLRSHRVTARGRLFFSCATALRQARQDTAPNSDAFGLPLNEQSNRALH